MTSRRIFSKNQVSQQRSNAVNRSHLNFGSEETGYKSLQQAIENPSQETLTPDIVGQLQRQFGNKMTNNILRKSKIKEIRAQSNNQHQIQRALGKADSASFIEYALGLLDVEDLDDLPKNIQDDINKVIAKTDDLSAAKSLFGKHKMFYRDVKKKVYTSSVKELLKEDDEGIDPHMVSLYQPMDSGGSLSRGGELYILATGQLGGCLGIAAYTSSKSFLAHWTPEQLSDVKPEQAEKIILRRLKEVKSKAGAGATIYLTSPSITVGYVQKFIQRLEADGHTIAMQDTSDTIALNVETGKAITGFRHKEVS